MKISSDKKLLGKWESDPSDIRGIEHYGRVTLEFSDNGRLTYTILQSHKREVMLLTYQVDGDYLVTNQESHPRLEKAKFFFTDDDALVLDYGEHKSYYVRIG
jgi:hypothetical protein